MILIVDDKQENIFSLRKLLEIHGFSVDTADSGEEALKKILNSDYTLILLDVQMPGMDGFEVAETISGYSRSKDIPIIFLSAVNTDKRFVAKGYASGGIDYITKPIDPDILMHKVRTIHSLTKQNRDLNIAHDSLAKEVAERKQSEEELNERVQELRSILESIPQIAFTTKPTGEIEFVNEGWYLYSNSDNLFPRFHPKDQSILDDIQHNFEKGLPFTREVRIENIITKEFRYHLLKLIPVRQAKTIIKWVGTFTDIHEQKKATELLERAVKERTQELQEKNTELESSNYELQQFAFVASHDLKEPLRKIQLFSSLLDSEADRDETTRKYVNKINESAKRMSDLITDLLEYSRLSVHSLFRQVDLNELMKDIVNELDFSIHEKNATIQIAPLPLIEAIPGQLRQVFQNLIVNALKFSRDEVPPVIDIKADIIEQPDYDSAVDPSGGYCRISVCDNGIGFNEQHLEKIFALFQRLNPRDEYEGTGIGLAIAKKIVSKHNGLITAKSKEGEGSTFILILPLQQTIHQNLQKTQRIHESTI